MIRIAISDRDTALAQNIRRLIVEDAVSCASTVRVDIYLTSQALIAQMQEGVRYDIIFLELENPDHGGMQAARAVRKIDKNSLVIALSKCVHQAVEGYSIRLFDFLLKPVQKEKIQTVLRRISDEYTHQKEVLIRVRVDSMDRNLVSRDIVYMESDKHYVLFHMKEGDTFQKYGKLDEYENLFAKLGSFIRCHQSYLVNMLYIEKIDGKDFVVGTQQIPISKAKIAQVKMIYQVFLNDQAADGGKRCAATKKAGQLERGVLIETDT